MFAYSQAIFRHKIKLCLLVVTKKKLKLSKSGAQQIHNFTTT